MVIINVITYIYKYIKISLDSSHSFFSRAILEFIRLQSAQFSVIFNYQKFKYILLLNIYK